MIVSSLFRGVRPLASLIELDVHVALSKRLFTAESIPGPKNESLSAINFQVTRQQAAQAFKEYHAGHIFSTKPSAGLQKVKESYLPFWVTTASASIHLAGARLGFDQWVQRYNPATKRMQSNLETQWQWVQLEKVNWEQRFLASDLGMQVYASYKYPRRQIDQLRPGATITLARPFEASMVDSDFDGSTRRVGPFQMKPEVALRFAKDWMRREAERRARTLLRQSFRCDRVADMDMRMELRDVRASPIFLPMFVFRSTHFGDKLRTFVSGVRRDVVVGTRAIDEARLGLVAAAASAVGIFASGLYASLMPWQIWVWGVVTPAAVVGFAARYYTHARGRWDEYWRERERDRQQEENEESSWDPEWVKAYARLEEESRSRDESAHSRMFGGSQFRGSTGDPQGYYQVLGLQPGASKQEVQAAYRGLALKHHPDRVPEAQKSQASQKFLAIQEAYSVLRDPLKRKDYDAGR